MGRTILDGVSRSDSAVGMLGGGGGTVVPVTDDLLLLPEGSGDDVEKKQLCFMVTGLTMTGLAPVPVPDGEASASASATTSTVIIKRLLLLGATATSALP